jgi:hypothetical protein
MKPSFLPAAFEVLRSSYRDRSTSSDNFESFFGIAKGGHRKERQFLESVVQWPAEIL